MKKVVIGISGGVDSAVAAILLKKQGYEVIGITFKFTDNFDETDAIKVCKKLDLEYHVFDYRKEFKEKVIDKFLIDYQNGITPNPCVLCNRDVKINFLYKEMKNLKCDFLATGHYAKIIDGNIFKSEDKNKDQTYFLCEVNKGQLSKLLLPLEGIEKKQVRKIAQENNLFNANKKDSTDVCFINEKFKDYISNNTENTKGDIIDISTNKKIGFHKGLSHYTIGQRRGLDIGGTEDRVFVVGKNINKNILYVCLGNSNDYLISNSAIIENVNYLKTKKIYNCKAKFRYHGEEADVSLEWLNNNKILVKYPQGIKSVTPGQICALYNEEECLGGGVIKEVRKNDKKLWYVEEV